jgi:hypothetical protein
VTRTRRRTRRWTIGWALLALLLPAGAARGKPLREVARIAVRDGIIQESFALDERGARIAYVVTDSRGATHLVVGSPGSGAVKATDITRFTSTPEQVIAVGGAFYVIANEGQRRAAAIGPNGGLGRQIGPFSDAFVGTAKGPALVAVTDRGERADGHAYDVAAFRAGGVQVGRRGLTIAADGTIAGTPGLVFQAFTNGYLQALVKRPGRYDARSDTRGNEEVAVYDVLTGAVSGAHRPGLREFADLVGKRAERPGPELFVRMDEDGAGMHLVGPGEKLRPLAFPGRLASYDPQSLDQQQNGARLYFAMVLDPLSAPAVEGKPRPARALHVFEANAGTARASEIGEIPLPDGAQAWAWSPGGDKVAFMLKTGAGAREIVVYAR